MAFWGPRGACAIAAGALALALAGCGDSPSSSNDDAGRTTSDELKAVAAAVEGLGPAERESKLEELARDEGGEVSLYLTASPRLAKPLAREFEAKHGIKVKLFSTDPGPLLQRVGQETSAGRRGVDVIDTGGPELTQLNAQNVLEPYDSPHQEALGPDAKQDGWTATRVNRYVVAWNTERVRPGDEPKSWEELADPRWKGKLVVDGGTSGVSVYKTLYEHWTGDGGKSEEEADRIWEGIAANARVSSGVGLASDLLAAGEFDASAGATTTGNLDRVAAGGAPVKWQPVIEPTILQLQGTSLVRDAPHPASAMLLLDFLFTDGQDELAKDYREPLREDLRSDVDVKELRVDLESLTEARDEWATRWDRLVGAGEKAGDG